MLQRYSYSHVSPESFRGSRFPRKLSGLTFHGSRALTFPTLFAAVLLLVLHFAHVSLMAQNVVSGGGGITFASLSGANNSPYSGSTEGDFSVSTNTGHWFKDISVYGNPPPSIYAGPTNSPSTSVLTISDSKGHFTFSSFDYSSNNGDSTYDIQAFLASVLEYEESGPMTGSFGPNFGFMTQGIGNSASEIDALQITVIPGSGVTSINLDNIMVATIPEPGCLGLVAMSMAVATCLSRVRRR